MIHTKFIAALGMALGLAGQAWAQAPKFPAKPIRMVVGYAPSMTALASGEVDFSFNNIPAAQPLMIPGRIRAVGITSAKRSPLLPELPTLIEGGLPGFITQTWYGVLAPAGTPGAVINTLNAVIVKAIRNDEFRARIAQTGADTITETPEYFRRMLKEEIERWAIVVKASKAKAE